MTLKTKRLLVKLNATDYADTIQKEKIWREMFGSIGNNVLIASDVKIYTATHSTKVSERTAQNWDENSGISFCNTFAQPVIIEDNVWIGGGSIILLNVTIGKNSVIGAGSIVTRSIPSNCVAVGNPCRVIKYVENE